MDAKDKMALVMHEVFPPENDIFDERSEQLYDASIASQQKVGSDFYRWRKYIFGIVVTIFFVVSIPLVVWSARKSGEVLF